MLMNVLVGLAKCGQGSLHILRRFFPCSGAHWIQVLLSDVSMAHFALLMFLLDT